MELSARELNADEGRAQDKRRRITREVQKIEDDGVRSRLVELIDKSGPMHQEQKAERARFTSEIDSLNGEVKSLKGEVEALVSEVEELNGKLTEQKVASKPSFWTLLDNKWVFAGVSALAVVFVFLIVALWGQSGVIDGLEWEVESAESRIKDYESTIEDYETWFCENLVKLEVSFSSTDIYAPKIYLNYQILTDLPAKFKFPDGRIELGVHASYGEIKEDSYWKFTPKGSSGVTDVKLSDILYKVLDQVDISGENFISIPITFTYCGKKLCRTTVKFDRYELERYEEDIKQRRSQGKNESSSER